MDDALLKQPYTGASYKIIVIQNLQSWKDAIQKYMYQHYSSTGKEAVITRVATQ